jgi:sigma-B regulation protein RsbU (phosphoserine phosphatase)
MPNILVVDDDTHVLQQIGTMLNSFGFDCGKIARGNDLFQQLEQEPADLIVMDVQIHGVSGLDLLREVKDHPKFQHIPVIMTTRDESDHLFAECFDNGAADFIIKPIKETTLLVRIRSILKAADAAQQLELTLQLQENMNTALMQQGMELKQAQSELDQKYKEERIRNERLVQDLEMARKLRDLIAGEFPESDRFQHMYKIHPAGEGGGDCGSLRICKDEYGQEKLLWTIHDQVGHGVESVLKAVFFEYLLQHRATHEDGIMLDPAAQLQRMNNLILRYEEPGSAACTAQILVIDLATMAVQYSSAGHHPAILVRADGSVEELPEKGFHLGYMPGLKYPLGTTQLGAGDRLFLFTDGIFELFRNSEEWFGYQRLQESFARHCQLNYRELYRSVMSDVSAFLGVDMLAYMEHEIAAPAELPPFDDILIMGLEIQ